MEEEQMKAVCDELGVRLGKATTPEDCQRIRQEAVSRIPGYAGTRNLLFACALHEIHLQAVQRAKADGKDE